MAYGVDNYEEIPELKNLWDFGDISHFSTNTENVQNT